MSDTPSVHEWPVDIKLLLTEPAYQFDHERATVTFWFKPNENDINLIPMSLTLVSEWVKHVGIHKGPEDHRLFDHPQWTLLFINHNGSSTGHSLFLACADGIELDK